MDRLDELEVQSIYILREAAVTVPEIIAGLEASREPERAGRAMDHESEDPFGRLRANGYM